eukprot:scaffold59195_cov16-Tisochrysis_lutea.AAC.2
MLCPSFAQGPSCTYGKRITPVTVLSGRRCQWQVLNVTKSAPTVCCCTCPATKTICVSVQDTAWRCACPALQNYRLLTTKTSFTVGSCNHLLFEDFLGVIGVANLIESSVVRVWSVLEAVLARHEHELSKTDRAMRKNGRVAKPGTLDEGLQVKTYPYTSTFGTHKVTHASLLGSDHSLNPCCVFPCRVLFPAVMVQAEKVSSVSTDGVHRMP